MSRKINPNAAKVVQKIITPIEDFMALESSSGIVLMIMTLVALVWANSPFYESYEHFIHMSIGLKVGNSNFASTLHHLVNDGLMVIFFFVVGLEIKRELVVGELSTPRKAALPMFAALGGMVVPALFYALFNHDGIGATGWGIPMATDIAFAVGVLVLFARNAPFSLKIFLLALAIVDDLGAVLVIAFFYTEQIHTQPLTIAFGLLVLMYLFRKAGVRKGLPFLGLGILVWIAILQSGIHATIAGVAIGFLTPLEPLYPLKDLPEKLKSILEPLTHKFSATEKVTLNHEIEHNLEELHHYVEESKSPLERSIHTLHPWVSFVIMPMFALVNAGVRIEGISLGDIFANPISLGIIAGLFLGKPLGVVVASFIAIKLKIAELPQGVNWKNLTAVGFLAGIGFTMALFVSHLALKTPELEVYSKTAILIASAFAGIVGAILLRLASGKKEKV